MRCMPFCGTSRVMTAIRGLSGVSSSPKPCMIKHGDMNVHMKTGGSTWTSCQISEACQEFHAALNPACPNHHEHRHPREYKSRDSNQRLVRSLVQPGPRPCMQKTWYPEHEQQLDHNLNMNTMTSISGLSGVSSRPRPCINVDMVT